MRWRAFFALPRFDTELDAVRARLIQIGLLTLLCGVLVALGWTALVSFNSWILLAVLGPSALLHVACLLLLRARRLRAAGLILVANAIATMLGLMVIANGFYDSALLILPLIYLCSSFLLERRDYLFVVVAAMLGLAGIFVLHLGDWYDTPIGAAHRADVPYDFGIILLISALTAIVPQIFSTQINRLLERAQQGERALREANATLDRRVAERTAEFERSNRELAIANRELATFADSLSHHLRTPLRAVGGYARILLEDHAAALGAEEQVLIARMESAALRLSRMGDALLAFSRLNERALEPDVLDLARVWRTLFEEAETRDGHERRFVWRVAAVPAVRADYGLLRQALRHLLDNAIKFSAAVEAPRIETGYDAERGEYYIRDNGVGLDMAYADKLFKVFERLHTEREFPGIGVGLATAHRIIARHGGQLRVESRPGHGATFFFTLPPAP